MKLYSMSPNDCSGKVNWLLNEIGEEFESVKLDWKKGDLKTDEFLLKHPLGQVPVLEDGDVTLYESYAIVAYLADKYPNKILAPKPNDLKKRAIYYQWLFFATDTADDFFNRYLKLSKMNKEYTDDWGEYIKDKTQRVMLTIDKQLESKEYILGYFSAVDPCLGYALDTVSEEKFFSDYPNVYKYYERLSQRDACKKSEIFKRN